MGIAIDSKKESSILFQLKSGRQKDPLTALATIKDIHAFDESIEINAYGNLSRNEVPNFVNYYKDPSDVMLANLMNRSSIFVTTSRIEGTPFPPLEAMSCGCAVVSTDSVGIRSYLIDGHNGLLADVGSNGAITEAIFKLLSDRNLRVGIALNGRKTALNYSYENMYNAFLKALAELQQ